ncbi:MAG TPA: GNAT family N-acetyltransferase [Lentisphaeria bacterium]|nr:GNAT family N-acetyltransferase [Lentisphaerota bacterium]OQC12802.1 MAG: putative acetyltransferase [Lentisphaerae bacterium ADurb.Bin082]HPY90232.1 GNAT family N-acetyltransferase [Lentisphaeria bacterium]HQL88341.1 GNAT family N-acetyltransferase [Lentisphaeria bacterium]
MKVDYSFITTVTPGEEKELAKLYREAEWWDGQGDSEWIRQLPQRSTLFLVARCEGRIVGMGRVIADGVSDGYLQDVFVTKAFRRQKIGSELVRTLTASAAAMGIDWLLLIAAPGKTQFYEALGYHVMPQYVPMRFGGRP